MLVLPAFASAKHHRAKHHRPEPPVVASGRTLFGVPWQATVAGSDPGSIQFSVDSRKRYQRGWLARNSLPSSPSSVFTATTVTNVDPRPEGELVGITSPSVVLLSVHMSDGSIFELYPTAPSAAAQSRVPSLSQVRVFAGFFPVGAVPQSIDAMDAGNNVLAERTSADGHF